MIAISILLDKIGLCPKIPGIQKKHVAVKYHKLLFSVGLSPFFSVAVGRAVFPFFSWAIAVGTAAFAFAAFATGAPAGLFVFAFISFSLASLPLPILLFGLGQN